jgi:hypothetical protein
VFVAEGRQEVLGVRLEELGEVHVVEGRLRVRVLRQVLLQFLSLS